uniref:Putative secreted protein n=1 Tax=Anopheles darlingi TaxID=43151 RepID=A0A2M4DR55_ANODA
MLNALLLSAISSVSLARTEARAKVSGGWWMAHHHHRIVGRVAFTSRGVSGPLQKSVHALDIDFLPSDSSTTSTSSISISLMRGMKRQYVLCGVFGGRNGWRSGSGLWSENPVGESSIRHVTAAPTFVVVSPSSAHTEVGRWCAFAGFQVYPFLDGQTGRARAATDGRPDRPSDRARHPSPLPRHGIDGGSSSSTYL